MVVVRRIAGELHTQVQEIRMAGGVLGEVGHREAAGEDMLVDRIVQAARRMEAGQVVRKVAAEEDIVGHTELRQARHKVAVVEDIPGEDTDLEGVGHKLAAAEEENTVRTEVEGNLFIISTCQQLDRDTNDPEAGHRTAADIRPGKPYLFLLYQSIQSANLRKW
jgi:hypothetical protein